MISDVKRYVERETGKRFNSCLVNLYRDKNDCVGFHADDEKLFGSDPFIASVSFGQARRFQMKRKDV